ncbi:hypothetical protein [Epilithonimonas xixisoli]|uniref:Uncharacterized protein n=1 Tax=Epilithonimonas xixisoli TaxID=1476462 RepID=A0A4R8IEA4_9FLAO|nr:hypothetical protein [Epilithonimonas xixisoli]TDX84058.1 hypothetical protein B0I22_1652 [Epilithonimonas xixisoli]
MIGNELFQKLSHRDYSGSDLDNYAQLLSTIFFHLSNSNEIENFFSLLVKANSENKMIAIHDPENIKDEYFYSDLILV